MGSKRSAKAKKKAAAASAASSAGEAKTWEVVGGRQGGGIVVREAKDLKSPELDKLAFGAVVQELSKEENRLQFRLLSGKGPSEGWANIRSRDNKELLKQRR